MKKARYIILSAIMTIACLSATAQETGNKNAIKLDLAPGYVSGLPNIGYERMVGQRKSLELSAGTTYNVNNELFFTNMRYVKLGFKYLVPFGVVQKMKSDSKCLATGFYIKPELNYVYRSVGGTTGYGDEQFSAGEEHLNEVSENNFAVMGVLGIQVVTRFITLEWYLGTGLNYSENIFSSRDYGAFVKGIWYNEYGMKIGFSF